MRSRISTVRAVVFCASLLAFNLAAAQETDTDALAKAAQNPISSMISLPFQWNSNFEVGPLDKPQHVLNIQPVYPLSVNDDWKVRAVKTVSEIFNSRLFSRRSKQPPAVGSGVPGPSCNSIRRVMIAWDREPGGWDRPRSH